MVSAPPYCDTQWETQSGVQLLIHLQWEKRKQAAVTWTYAGTLSPWSVNPL